MALLYFTFKQEIIEEGDLESNNELEAVKMAIVRSLSCLSYGQKGKYINIKSICIDLPLSRNTFRNKFPVEYCGQDNFKQLLDVDELNCVFGDEWHVYNFPKSSTRNRIIGLILLHFRRKKIDVFPHANQTR